MPVHIPAHACALVTSLQYVMSIAEFGFHHMMHIILCISTLLEHCFGLAIQRTKEKTVKAQGKNLRPS